MRLALVMPTVSAAPVVHAQKAADHLKRGIAAYDAVKPGEALRHYQAGLATDSSNYDLNARAARAAVDLAISNRTNPDSLFTLAERYARRAVAIDSMKPEGHALVAVTVGAAAHSANARGKFGGTADKFRKLFVKVRECIQEAERAIALDPKRDVPHRMLGFWHANIAGLPEQQRKIADPVLGPLAATISWGSAIKHLEKAAELAPTKISNHMALAQVYAIQKRNADARRHFEKIEALPIMTINDTSSKAQAKTLLAKLPIE